MIAIDQRAVQGLVGALAPLSIGADSETVTGETIIPFIRRAWEPEDGMLTGEWLKQRKSFMGPLAAAVWRRIEQGQVDWSKLIRTVLRPGGGETLAGLLSATRLQRPCWRRRVGMAHCNPARVISWRSSTPILATTRLMRAYGRRRPMS